MQYLKDEIRNRINAAALGEFLAKGYRDASMRVIAADAGVAIGNVYRYYKNKDELFNSIIEPVYSEISSLVKNLYRSQNFISGIDNAVKVITNSIVGTFNRHSSELLILIYKSEGSRYQDMKDDLINQICIRLEEELVPALKKTGIMIEDNYIYRIMASTFLDGVFMIFSKYTDPGRVQYLVGSLVTFYFQDIVNRFGREAGSSGDSDSIVGSGISDNSIDSSNYIRDSRTDNNGCDCSDSNSKVKQD